MSKPQEPKQEWGFYAVTPRIVRTKYKDLSHAEKWLYTCLKDLCGDKGSCFRSLRSLEEETDISTGSLSKMIPHLHQVGLIHAEKKRRSKSGKEVWHITIVDIWQENAKHCKDCSKNEQCNDEIVQKMNEVQGDCSKNEHDCSKNERSPELDCSNFVDRRIRGRITTEERKNECAPDEKSSTGNPLTQSVNPSSSSVSQETPQEKKLTEIDRVKSYWKQLGLLDENSTAWGKLAETIKSFEDFKSLYEYTRKQISNNASFTKKAVHPGNMANNFNEWKQAEQAKQRAEAAKSAPISSKPTSSVSGLRNYNIEPEVQPLIPVPKLSLTEMRKQMKEKGMIV